MTTSASVNPETTKRKKMRNHAIPHLSDIEEPQMVTLIAAGRAGTKFFQSCLDGHKNILMIPGYPLMYLYPHFDDWCKRYSKGLSWDLIIDLFCEKHASVLDSRKVYGLSGLARLGPNGDQHIEINEQMFRDFLKTMLDGVPIQRRSFLLAVHYAYGLCKQWDLKSRLILCYHIHDAHLFPKLVEDFPNLKLICMVRNPRLSMHSMVRSFPIVDRAKLNCSDSLRLFGRIFWLACLYQFEGFDYLKGYLGKEKACAVKLESLQELEQTMRSFSDWLGVSFNESMLSSTFDGKLWSGDVATERRVGGFNADILTDAWRKSISKFDSFVIEGISFHFFKQYDYERIAYKRDTLMHRILLMFAILIPTKIEWRIIKFYFNPRLHFRFLRATFDESSGRIPRKDYTWNATYLYKWTYQGLKLWQKRWHERFLDFINERFKTNDRSLHASGLIAVSQILYIAGQYGGFLVSAFAFPAYIFRRWSIYYRSFWKRVNKRVFLPALVNNVMTNRK